MQRYLSLGEAAAYLGLTRDGLRRRFQRYPLEPDVLVGTTRGWSQQRLDDHAATVPLPGAPPRDPARRPRASRVQTEPPCTRHES